MDYTRNGDNDDVEVLYDNGKKIKIKKKFVKPIELFETGVYNSEMDIHANPKTAENKPDKIGGTLGVISDKVQDILDGLEDLKAFIKDNTKLSHKIVDSSIADFQSYLSSLKNESETISNSSIN